MTETKRDIRGTKHEAEPPDERPAGQAPLDQRAAIPVARHEPLPPPEAAESS